MTQNSITLKFVVALTVIAILAGSDYALLAHQIRLTETNAQEIDVSARQRMLSQRAVYLATIIAFDPAENVRKIAAADLGATIDELEQAHRSIAPDRDSNARPDSVSEEVSSIYFEYPFLLDQKTRDYIAATRTLLSVRPEELTRSNIAFHQLMDATTPLLAAQEAAVAQYQIEGRKRLSLIRGLDKLTLLIIILCLFATGQFIFRPMLRQINRDIDAKASGLSDAQFKSLSEASPIGIFLNDASGNCTYTNPRWQQITGVDYDTSLGAGWSKMIYSGDKERVFSEWETEVSSGREFSSEFRINTPSREIRWVHSRAAPIESVSDSGAKTLIGFVGTTEDITERKRTQDELQRSRERFDLAIRGTDDGIWDWDLRTDESYYSPRYEALLGYEKSTFGQNYESFESLLHPDDKVHVLDSIRRHLELREPYQVEYRLKTKENGYLWFSAGGQAEWGEDGKAIRMAGSIRDITERLRTAQELRRYSDEAVQAHADSERHAKVLQQRTEALSRSNKELEQFAYISSHDLQEPLRKIQSFGDRLNGKYGDVLGDQGRDYIERMRASAGRMQTLIQDLLDYSRVSREHAKFLPIDLTQILDDVVADLESRIEREHGRVEYGALPTIEGDSTQLRQLFQNLIGNALKFHVEDKPPIVSISSHERSTTAGNSTTQEYCEIKIQDNGIGFDEKYSAKIFTPFQRLHGRNEYEGTGIGLAVCQKIVERHGGEIIVQSAPGEGSTFVVTLPVEQSESAVAA